MFTSKDVAEYYNTTQNHYLKWWNLKKDLSLHYGIWDKDTKSFSESLVNTNRVMMEIANITDSDKVLDAGCGVGGAAIFITTAVNSSVIGISLSEKQVNFAQLQAKERKLDAKISFEQMDYTNTSFKDSSFDVVWACESISSATDKVAFIKEAHRILKSGGRLIMSDFFLSNEDQHDKHRWMYKWGKTWSISHFVSTDSFSEQLTTQGFSISKNLDCTSKIRKSANRIYYASLLGAIPSWIYNAFHPNVSKFAKTHYLSGYYQYKALKADLWKYQIILAIKNEPPRSRALEKPLD